MLIADIKINGRHRKELGDIQSLANSIREIGLLHPVVVKPDGTLIAGERRIAAYKELGKVDIPATIVSNLNDAVLAIKAERDENTCRKDFVPSEAVAVAETLEPLEREKAKERQQKSGGANPGSVKFSEPPALDKVASAVGMTRPTLTKAKEVVQAAKREPEKYQPLVAEMDRTGKVNGAHKKLVVMQQAEQIRQEPPPTPLGPFRVIVVDPPWKYDNRAEDVSHRAANPYPDMSIEQIKCLEVAKLAADDCILWLWTTNAFIRQAHDIAETWGFEVKTILTWVKDRIGTGDWLRGQTEHCLLCVKGKPVVTLTNQSTVITASLREHSRKPDEFYQLVNSLCPGSKLEMFARAEREGWVSHGNTKHLFP